MNDTDGIADTSSESSSQGRPIGGIRTADGYHYHVDAPKNWTLADYRTKIVGWCVHPNGRRPTGVRVRWEGGEAYGRYGEPRPDVYYAFQLPKALVWPLILTSTHKSNPCGLWTGLDEL